MDYIMHFERCFLNALHCLRVMVPVMQQNAIAALNEATARCTMRTQYSHCKL